MDKQQGNLKDIDAIREAIETSNIFYDFNYKQHLVEVFDRLVTENES